MNSISEFDNGLDDDLDNCWDDSSIHSDDSIEDYAPSVKKAKITGNKSVKGVLKKKADPVKKYSKVLSSSSGSTEQNIGEKTKPKFSSVNTAIKSDTKSTITATKNDVKADIKKKQTPGTKITANTVESEIAQNTTENTGETSFPLTDFDLTESTVQLLKERGIESLFPIQAESFWPVCMYVIV